MIRKFFWSCNLCSRVVRHIRSSKEVKAKGTRELSQGIILCLLCYFPISSNCQPQDHLIPSYQKHLPDTVLTNQLPGSSASLQLAVFQRVAHSKVYIKGNDRSSSYPRKCWPRNPTIYLSKEEGAHFYDCREIIGEIFSLTVEFK